MFFASGTMLSKTAPRAISRWLRVRCSSWDSFCRNTFSRFSNCRIFFFPSSISACSSSRVFSLGFVMVGRSFLLIGIEKGQSIFSAALLGKNFFSLILLKFLLLRKCDLRHTQFLKLRQSYQMLLVLTNPFLRLMLQ